MFIIGNLTAGDIAKIRLYEVRARAEAIAECRAWSEIDILYPPLPALV